MILPIRKKQDWMPSIFDDFFDNSWRERMGAIVPAVNVLETKKEYKVEFAAPGMTKEDFNVHLNDNNDLVISIEKKKEEQKEEQSKEPVATEKADESKEKPNDSEKECCRYLRKEFSYTSYQQAFTLPVDVDKEAISAHVDNGVLTVTLPKLTFDKDKKGQRVIAID